MIDGIDEKTERLREVLRELDRMVLGLSGGVDSSFLLHVARETVGDGVVALTTVSPTNPEEDTRDAVALAGSLDVEHVVIHADELEIPGYRENPVDRCYFCKGNLYTLARAEADRRGIQWIVDGVNTDDLGDYRPGLNAAEEHQVRHPLVEAGFDKAAIREACRRRGLELWDRPASPCLSSRFPYGTPITREGLDRVSRGEAVLRLQGFRECRVRFHGDVARVEVPVAEMARLLDESTRRAVVDGLREAGFRFVSLDLEGFRSGSLNRGVAEAPTPAGDPPAR